VLVPVLVGDVLVVTVLVTELVTVLVGEVLVVTVLVTELVIVLVNELVIVLDTELVAVLVGEVLVVTVLVTVLVAEVLQISVHWPFIYNEYNSSIMPTRSTHSSSRSSVKLSDTNWAQSLILLHINPLYSVASPFHFPGFSALPKHESTA